MRSQPDEMQRTLALASVSTDGDVVLWTMTKGELSPERLLRLAPAARDRVAGTGAAAAAALSAPGSSLASSACAAELLVVQQRIVGGLCLDFGRVRSTYIHTYMHTLMCCVVVQNIGIDLAQDAQQNEP